MYYFYHWNTTIIHLFIVMLLKAIKFDLHKNVLVAISFICIDFIYFQKKKRTIFLKKYESIMRKRNWTLIALIDTTLYLLVCTLYLVLFSVWRGCPQLFSYTPHADWWCEKEIANAGLRDNVYKATCRTTKLLESNLRPKMS